MNINILRGYKMNKSKNILVLLVCAVVMFACTDTKAPDKSKSIADTAVKVESVPVEKTETVSSKEAETAVAEIEVATKRRDDRFFCRSPERAS